jgi:hypothetical protein
MPTVREERERGTRPEAIVLADIPSSADVAEEGAVGGKGALACEPLGTVGPGPTRPLLELEGTVPVGPWDAKAACMAWPRPCSACMPSRDRRLWYAVRDSLDTRRC